MPSDLQAVVPWIDVVRIFASVTGLLYSLAMLLSLSVYLRLRRPRVHRVLIGFGSQVVTMILALRLWVYPQTFSMTWATVCWAGFALELVGLTAIIARDTRLTHDFDA